MLVSRITKERIHSAGKRLKGGRMAGADGFGPELYKIMQDYLPPIFLKIFSWVKEKRNVPPNRGKQ